MLARLQLLVTRKLDGLLQGDYLGLLPGPGTEAGESREYRPGDDVRRMDWPVTARTTDAARPADRSPTGSWRPGWRSTCRPASTSARRGALKRDLVDRRGRRDGAPDRARRQPDRRGGRHRRRSRPTPRLAPPACQLARLPAGCRPAPAARRRRACCARSPAPRCSRAATDLGALIDALNRPPRRRGLAVVISDFLGAAATVGAAAAQARRPPRRARDRGASTRASWSCPTSGVLALVDPETGALHEVQTADPAAARAGTPRRPRAQRAAIAAALRGAGAAHLRLRTDSDWLLDIVRFVAAQRHARTRGTTR